MKKIKKGDIVKVIKGRAKNQFAKTGTTYSDKQGVSKVIKVDYKRNKVWLEGLNLVKRHLKPDQNNPKGRIVEIEAPIDISNVMLVDPKTGEPTRVGFKILEDGTKVRYSKKTNEIIDK